MKKICVKLKKEGKYGKVKDIKDPTLKSIRFFCAFNTIADELSNRILISQKRVGKNPMKKKCPLETKEEIICPIKDEKVWWEWQAESLQNRVSIIKGLPLFLNEKEKTKSLYQLARDAIFPKG